MTADMKEIEDLLGKSSAWLPKAMEQVGCTAPVDVTSAACRHAMKETLVLLFTESYHLVRFQNERMKQLKAELSSTKSQLIENQKWVISLQEKVLDCKEQQLVAVQTAVKTTVEDSVKEQFKSYSDAVQDNVMVVQPDVPAITPKVLKEVMQSIVQEEDRCKNLMVFGIPEEDSEDLTERVHDVLQEIGFKPTIEVSRVGKANKEKKRPVKVTLSSSSIARQILSQTRRLHKSESFGSVFVRPDRSEEERSRHRLLVEELFKKREDEPSKRHYIQRGTIHSVEKLKADV
jgi:molybdopterin-biosynthesis enzyme MoeA-like protein